MRAAIRRLTALGAALVTFGALAAPAWGATGDPLFTFVPTTATAPKVLPAGYLTGPCGLGVDSSGRLLVSDYYHHTVDFFNAGNSLTYAGQLAGEDPLDGPCGLALDSTNRLYVNNFDRGVARFNAYPTFGTGTTIAGAGVDSANSTGVAVGASDNVYVDDRTYITAYDSSGVQLLDAGNPLKIGDGTLGEGYGLAIDASGRLYVADASDDTVKVYDPAAVDKSTPVLTIAGPPGGFNSLRHAAVAVNRVSGALYVADNLQPQYAEEPDAQVDAFDPSGVYLGVLKYQIADALPSGLAVDNSGGANQGRVYVTSGNTNQAGIYAYAAGSQIGSSSPPSIGLVVKAAGSGGGAVTSNLGGLDCASTCSADVRSGATVSLAATPDPGSTFAGWSGGGCEGAGECTVTMDQATSVSADFEAPPGADFPAGDMSDPATSTPSATTPARPFHPKRRHHAKRRHRRHRKHHRGRSHQSTCKSGCRSP